MTPTNVAPLTIKGVCLNPQGRVLLCRTSRQDWELPGGRPEIGESFPACVSREIHEETGLTATVHELITAFPYQVLPGRWVNVIVYSCQLPDSPPPTASPEHQQVAFLDPDTLTADELATEYRLAIDLGAKRG